MTPGRARANSSFQKFQDQTAPAHDHAFLKAGHFICRLLCHTQRGDYLGKHPEIWQTFICASGLDLHGTEVPGVGPGGRLHENIRNVDEWKNFRDGYVGTVVGPKDTELSSAGWS
jgi:hypothetical protein